MDRDKRIKLLAEHLIWAVNQAYIDSDLIQEALNQIEAEGYQVDILLAAFTRFDKAETGFDGETTISQSALFFEKAEESEEDPEDDSPLSSEFNEFDRTFLKLVKIGYEERA